MSGFEVGKIGQVALAPGEALPTSDQSANTGDVLLGRIEGGIDVAGGTDDAVSDHRDAIDQDVLDSSFIEVVEDLAESAHGIDSISV